MRFKPQSANIARLEFERLIVRPKEVNLAKFPGCREPPDEPPYGRVFHANWVPLKLSTCRSASAPAVLSLCGRNAAGS